MKKIDEFPLPLQRVRIKGSGSLKIVLTEPQAAWLRKYFPILENSRIMKRTTLTHATLHRFAREMGLKKSPQGDHAIRVRTGQRVKRMLEKNGYYDSIRGVGTGGNNEGSKRYWQEVREGKRKNPWQIFKERHPRKYAALKRKHSEERTRTIHMEQFRMMSGMKRTTRLHIPLSTYSRRQINHRYHAVHVYGYIVYDHCDDNDPDRWNIYYDANTRRAARFEANLKKDGFHILDGTNL